MDDLINDSQQPDVVSDDEEIMQEPVAEESSVVEPLVIETKGKWQPFEAMTGQEMEVGHTYKIEVAGVCEFAISKDRPSGGMGTNSITYTKQEDNRLWIKTGG